MAWRHPWVHNIITGAAGAVSQSLYCSVVTKKRAEQEGKALSTDQSSFLLLPMVITCES